MKVHVASLFLVLLVAEGAHSNPLSEVIALLNNLQAKVTKEGELELKAFKEYSAWCDDYSKDTQNDLKTATMQKAKLEAEMEELSGEIEVTGSKIEELGGAIATASKELKDATDIRKKEKAEFNTAEAELLESIDLLDRAIAVLERQMAKNPAALMQLDTTSMANLLQSLDAVIDAASFSAVDRQSLVALVQARQEADSDDADVGAPAATAYKSHSANIVDVLQDMKEKAESQLSKLRKAEVNTRHNFEMLRQSLEDQIGADTKDLDASKTNKAAATEAKAVATGDLEGTNKDLATLKQALASADTSCKQVAEDHADTVAARAEELKTIADAIQVLTSQTGGAEAKVYSLLQVESNLRSHGDLVKSEVLVMVKRLAKQHQSAALAQLASRIAAAVQIGSANGDDVFAKVKGLIKDLISKLEKDAGADATEKAFCDEELAKTKAKKEDLDSDIAKMTSKIDRAAARSAELKADVKDLQAELAALAKAQAKMDQIRSETQADFIQAKADLEQGLAGVRKALVILRDYYAKDAAAMVDAGQEPPEKPKLFVAAGGAGNSIIGILEVVESDFAKDLAKEETQEDDAQAMYEKMTQENAVTKTVKDQDVKYKTAEFKTLDKNINELSSDRKTANNELDAVLEYYSKLQARCIAKPETYEARRDRRAAEIAGLKSAMEILENETAFMQRKQRSGNMRGALSL